MTSVRPFTLSFLGLLASWPLATAGHGQCPDGTPPPCRAAAAPRANPALDDRAWLILPFVNTAGAADAAMLSQASVNLLYQNLARWQDVRVVSDDRVADLLRALPAAERERPGLQSGLTLARRVGAGRLVLGDYLALGGQAQLNAKVYDVRSGRQLRLVHEQLKSMTSLDSITAGFGRLARGVLNVPAAGGENAGVGTGSLDAYREYVAGMEALNHINLDPAVAHFRRAVAIDSGFAIAHLRLYESIPNFGNGLNDDQRQELARAVRLSSSLPPRERSLVAAHASLQSGDRATLCSSARTLLGADSSDAESWMLMSLCFADMRLGPLSADSVHASIRGDYGAAINAIRRGVSLAPGTVAEGTLMQMLGLGTVYICPDGSITCPPRQLYVGAIILHGDSARIDLTRWLEARSNPPYLAPEAVGNYIDRLNEARAICQRIAAASAGQRLLDVLLFRYHVALGDTAAAVALLPGVVAPADSISRLALEQRFTLALQRFRPADVAVMLDSVRTPYRSLFGRFAEGGDTSLANRQTTLWRPILAGVLPAGFDTIEARIAARLTGPAREDFLQLSTLAGFRMRHAGPVLDTAATHPIKRAQAWIARGDTAKARAALADYDRLLFARHPATPDDGGWLFSAETYLDLGDTTSALEHIRSFARNWTREIAIDPVILEDWYFQRTSIRLWGRAWMLYGDLAQARGQHAEARRAYLMVVGFWDGGDAPVQPLVTRARAALAQLGS